MRRPTILAALALVSVVTACRRHPPIAPTPPPWLDGKVDEQGKAASQDGDRVGSPFHGVAYKKGESNDWTLMLDESKCYWFSGVGDEQVEKLYLYLFDPNDKRVQTKKPDGPMAVLTYCPEVSGMYRVEAKADEGAGHFAVGVYAKAGPPRAVKLPPPAAPDLEQAVEQAASAAAPGATRVGNFYGGSVDKQDWFTALEPGKCYWIVGAGMPGRVKKLSLYLWDPANKRVTDNRADSPNAMIGHCPTQPGMYKFEAKVESGSGEYRVGVYAKAGSGGAMAPQAPAASLEDIVNQEAEAAAPGAKRVGKLYGGKAEKTDWLTPLEVGKCYWFVGAGAPGKVEKLSIYLWDQSNKRVTENRSDGPTAMVGHCPTQPGMFKFEAKVEGGSGEYKVGVFAKPQGQ
jgi:hypothetical protein